MKRYPFAPLETLVGAPSAKQLADALGVHPRQVYRWRSTGVTADQADLLAVRLHSHPFEVWPEMADELLASAEQRALEMKRARDRRYRRRKRQDPNEREREREYLRDYRAEARGAAKAYARRYYRANRTVLLERQRERDRVRRAKAA